MGIKSPDSYYAQSKIRGKASRDKHIDGSKVPQKETSQGKNIFFKDPLVDPNIYIRGNRYLIIRCKNLSLNKLPKCVEKNSNTEFLIP